MGDQKYVIKNHDVVCGIDYSLTCPAVTIFRGNQFGFGNCKTHYLTSTKKYQGTFLEGKLVGHIYSPEMFIGSPIARYNFLADWAYSLVRDIDFGLIEGYSFGSRGKVFHIAENTGLLKYFLWFNGVYDRVQEVAPTAVKKFATGKGSAPKEGVYEKFVEDTGVDLVSLFKNDKEAKIDSPLSDIADSYFICKIAFEKYQDEKEKSNKKN